MKKVALLCALVMLVSIIPAYAASQTDDVTKNQDKHQFKFQKGTKNNQNQAGTCDKTGNGDCDKLQKRLKTQDRTCTTTST